MIQIEVPDIQEIEERLGKFKHKAPTVLYRAINRATSNIKTNISKNSRKRYIAKDKDIKNTIKFKRASRSNLGSLIESTAHRISLSKFEMKPKKLKPKKNKKAKAKKTRRKKSPVIPEARVLESSGLKRIKGAFAANVKAGNNYHAGIFKRAGKFDYPKKGRYRGKGIKRENIKQLVGPAVPQMIKNEAVLKSIREQAVKKLDERIDHEIKRILNKK